MLTKELVLSKSPNITSLSQIKTLNLWGKELEDISIISQMTNLEIISLSANKVSSLAPFSSCTILKELYLRRNNISSLSEIDYLVPCSSLSILWIDQNPIFNDENYHDYIISKLPQLIKFDNVIVNSKRVKKQMNRVMAINQSFVKDKPRNINNDDNKDREYTEINHEEQTPRSKELNRYQSFGHFSENKTTSSSSSNGTEMRNSKKLKLKSKDPLIKSPERKDMKFPILISKTKKALIKSDNIYKASNYIHPPLRNHSKNISTILNMVDDIELNDMLVVYKEIKRKIRIKQKEM